MGAVSARYEPPGIGHARSCAARSTASRSALEVPTRSAAAPSSRPRVAKLWASERIRDLEAAQLDGRRAERMKQRIVELAVEHGISSQHTSFVVVEKRTATRRATGSPRRASVPVNLPAGWDMMKPRTLVARAPMTSPGQPMYSLLDDMQPLSCGVAPSDQMSFGRPAQKRSKTRRASKTLVLGGMIDSERSAAGAHAGDSTVDLLNRQCASGLWGDGEDPVSARATVAALIELHTKGIDSSHPLYGAQVKKAIEALLALAAKLDATDEELVLATALLCAGSRRVKANVERAVQAAELHLPSGPQALRQHVATLQRSL